MKMDKSLVMFIFLFSSVILVNWFFDDMTTYYLLLLLIFGILVYRGNEIENLINPKEKQKIYYPNLKYQ
jgi:hypothetical protein